MQQAAVEKRILASNDEAAVSLRERFRAAGVLVVDLISSPGSGKTTLLERTAVRLSKTLRLGAIVGDIATELDADRLRDARLPAHQIVTGGACHLDARMIDKALAQTPFPNVDILFIENVGNLVCPASYALGEDFKVALLSVTEGADKPFKYPAIFAKACVTLVTKIDLLPHVSFDVDTVRGQVLSLNPEAQVLATSMHGEGLDSWCDLLVEKLEAKRSESAATS